MKRYRFTALPVFAALWLSAGCTGSRTNGNAAYATAAGKGAAEAVTPAAAESLRGEICTRHIPDPAAESAARIQIDENGSRRRWGPFVENDTTFLFVDEYPIGNDTNRYKVFIRKAPQASDGPNFTTFPLQDEMDRKDFTRQLRAIKKNHPEPLAHHAALEKLPYSWTPVGSFGGNYYVNGFNPFPVWISDSLFIRQFMDGPLVSLIDDAERILPTHYRLRTTAGYSGIEQVDIHIVDTVRKIAVFTFGNDEKTTEFQSLYAPVETALGMDMVDFYSLELPEEVIAWDEVDYQALIRRAETIGRAAASQGMNQKEIK